MRLFITLHSIGLSLATISLMVAPLAAQGPVIHDITDLRINEPTLIPGKVLPAGEYVISVVNPTLEGNIVQFRDKKTNKVEATVMALANYRTRITDKTVLQYWETPKGMPKALRAWFYPDEHWGEEFVYPTEMLKQIKNHRQIAQVQASDYGSSTPLKEQTAEQVDLTGVSTKKSSNASATTAPKSAAKATTTTQVPTQPTAPATKAKQGTGTATSKSVVAKAPQQTQPNQSSASAATAPQQPSSQPAQTLLAQNQSKTKTPFTTAQNRENSAKSAPTKMPQTASPAPTLFLAGFVMLAGALLLRYRRRIA